MSGSGPSELVEGVLAGDRAAIGRAITLVESRQTAHSDAAASLLEALLPHSGEAYRVGITGVPGVGKSTFIESLGARLTGAGHRVAVLAVDPSSGRSGGSILGDKTRMPALAVDPNAFIRPSPTSGHLGGVATKTRESMVVLEAAGHDVVLVETVGVGQSETLVAGMVDFFLVLMLPGAGDELQGIKKGILEYADMVAVNKADGDNAARAREAARDYTAALRLLYPGDHLWTPPVVRCSGLTGEGLDALWAHVEDHRRIMTESGELARRREAQRIDWMWSMIDDRLLRRFREAPAVAALVHEVERQIGAGAITPALAAEQLLAAYDPGPR